MVNNLLQVKPAVPHANNLQKWSHHQDYIKNQITQVRYGTPKPYQQIQIKVNSAMRNSVGAASKGSNRSLGKRTNSLSNNKNTLILHMGSDK